MRWTQYFTILINEWKQDFYLVFLHCDITASMCCCQHVTDKADPDPDSVFSVSIFIEIVFFNDLFPIALVSPAVS